MSGFCWLRLTAFDRKLASTLGSNNHSTVPNLTRLQCRCSVFAERVLNFFVYVSCVVAAILESKESWDERTKAWERKEVVKKNACR